MTTNKKPLIEKRLSIAGIDKESKVYRLILKFEKSIHTCWNMISNNHSYEKVHYSKPFETASDCLDLLNNGGNMDYNEAEYYLEWSKYCDVSKLCSNSNINDFLA